MLTSLTVSVPKLLPEPLVLPTLRPRTALPEASVMPLPEEFAITGRLPALTSVAAHLQSDTLAGELLVALKRDAARVVSGARVDEDGITRAVRVRSALQRT